MTSAKLTSAAQAFSPPGAPVVSVDGFALSATTSQSHSPAQTQALAARRRNTLSPIPDRVGRTDPPPRLRGAASTIQLLRPAGSDASHFSNELRRPGCRAPNLRLRVAQACVEQAQLHAPADRSTRPAATITTDARIPPLPRSLARRSAMLSPRAVRSTIAALFDRTAVDSARRRHYYERRRISASISGLVGSVKCG